MEENQINHRRRKESPLKNLWETFSSYSQEATIHSVNYIGRNNLHWIERAFWISAFLFAFSSCSYFVYKTYEKWENDPMLVSFNERATPTWQIPFPAITVCPESKFDSEKFNFDEVLNKIRNNESLTSKEKFGYEALYHVCDIELEREVETKCNVVKTLREMSSNFMNVSFVHKANFKLDFTDEFKETVTRNGICYTMNMLNEKDLFKKSLISYLRTPKDTDRSNWTSYGYDTSDPFTYPRRVFGSGKETEIKITLKMKKKDIDYTCKSSGDSFRLTIHAPNEIPQTNSKFFRLPFNTETLILIEPKVVTTSEDLRGYKPKERQCFFPGEEELNFFKSYSSPNCRLECFSDFVLEKCGCVRFSMPHRPGTKICTRSELNCINEMQTLYILLEAGRASNDVSEKTMKILEALKAYTMKNKTISDEKIEEIFEKESDIIDGKELDNEDEKNFEELESNMKTCHCLPSCSSINYGAKTSQSPIKYHKHLKSKKVLDEEDEEYETTVVSIYFEEDYFIEAKRSELFGLTNFLSSCGGFLGLLMGGSFLSVLEIFYHFVIKKIFHPKSPNVEVPENDAETKNNLLKD